MPAAWRTPDGPGAYAADLADMLPACWRLAGPVDRTVASHPPYGEPTPTNLLAGKTQIWTVRQLMVSQGGGPPRVIFISSPNVSFSRSGGWGWLAVRRMGVVTRPSGADARPMMAADLKALLRSAAKGTEWEYHLIVALPCGSSQPSDSPSNLASWMPATLRPLLACGKLYQPAAALSQAAGSAPHPPAEAAGGGRQPTEASLQLRFHS
jgi:hypothetical protein